ncbi:hypothetical protein KFK09_021178 [Dendrobium nobile]|uniref:Uncharacterized protein n=1 Tax=Dendrobium nobile TaxID=94219 RepID=A0A8T3ANI7_DENNO|nr:hypothetical protein KFK09_021178 [Dendrobium nobile]
MFCPCQICFPEPLCMPTEPERKPQLPDFNASALTGCNEGAENCDQSSSGDAMDAKENDCDEDAAMTE